MEVTEDREMFFVSMVLGGKDEDNEIQSRTEVLEPEEEYEKWLKRQKEKKILARSASVC